MLIKKQKKTGSWSTYFSRLAKTGRIKKCQMPRQAGPECEKNAEGVTLINEREIF